jgi:hypothetical protein
MMMSDLIERLRGRTLAKHGGPSRPLDGWNLSDLDSELHVEAATEIETLRTSLAHWKVFGEHAEGERSRLKHNEAVMMNALYKACGDDEEMVRQTIESQGVLRPDPALLARCPTGKCDDPARDCFGSGCLGPNVGGEPETTARTNL